VEAFGNLTRRGAIRRSDISYIDCTTGDQGSNGNQGSQV